MTSFSGMPRVLIEGFTCRAQIRRFQDERRTWLFVSVWPLEGAWRKLPRNCFQIEMPQLTHDPSPLPGKMARLYLRRTSGVGPIFPVSYMSNNLLVPASPKESQMIRYAASMAMWLLNVALTSGVMAERGRCGSSPRRILATVLGNFLGT
jgi:hypothetical protein